MKKIVVVFSLLAVLLAGCTEKHYQITGEWDEGDGMVVYLKKEIGKNEYETLATDTVRNGTFKFSGKLEQVDARMVEVEGAKQEILMDEVPIHVKVIKKTNARTGNVYNSLEATGSEEQELLKTARSFAMGSSLMGLGSMMMMVQVKDDPVKLDSVYRVTQEMKRVFEESMRVYLDTNTNSYAAAFFIADFYLLNNPLADAENYYNRLTPRVKESYPGKRLEEKMASFRSISMGGIAAEIALPTPDGEILKLSSLRGKYVLIDFWASWCGPCLAEVPNVKEIYDKYHDRGFEIYGVSLDEKEDLWKNAIEKHGLNWLHVSSLQGWKCPAAARYNVTGIPRMYILDREGRIVAMDLRGEELKKKVASFFE